MHERPRTACSAVVPKFCSLENRNSQNKTFRWNTRSRTP